MLHFPDDQKKKKMRKRQNKKGALKKIENKYKGTGALGSKQCKTPPSVLREINSRLHFNDSIGTF